jgi:hypothetical protein
VRSRTPVSHGRPARSGRSALSGWGDPEGLAQRIMATSAPGRPTWYRLGDAALAVRSDNKPFRDRFRLLFGECRTDSPPAAARVQCRVVSIPSPAVSLVTFDDGEPLDQVAFARAIFADRGYRISTTPLAGWHVVTADDGPPILAMSDGRILARRRGAWEGFVGSLAVNRVLRLQRDSVFLHAAAVAIGGAGLLMTGPKGGGKTTLALALAARGHAFFGDEMTGVRLGSRELIPLRRAASVRDGPRARAVDQALQGRTVTTDRFPDGSRRARVPVGRLFPQAALRPAMLRHVVVLRRLGAAPRLESFIPGPEHLRYISPLACSLWDLPPARRAMQILSLLAGVQCSFLDVGTPEATADLLQRTMEA